MLSRIEYGSDARRADVADRGVQDPGDASRKSLAWAYIRRGVLGLCGLPALVVHGRVHSAAHLGWVDWVPLHSPEPVSEVSFCLCPSGLIGSREDDFLHPLCYLPVPCSEACRTGLVVGHDRVWDSPAYHRAVRGQFFARVPFPFHSIEDPLTETTIHRVGRAWVPDVVMRVLRL